jgi:hypothetical protein
VLKPYKEVRNPKTKKTEEAAEEQKPPRKRRKKSSTTGSDSGVATSPAREPSPEYNEVLNPI